MTRSRIGSARRRTRAIKALLAGAAATAFVLTAGLVRTAHPGASGRHAVATPRAAALEPPQRLVDELSSSSFFEPGNVGPADGGAPAVETSTS